MSEDPKYNDPTYEEGFDEFDDFRESEVVSVDSIPLKDDELISLSEEEQNEIYQQQEEANDAETWSEESPYSLPDFLKKDPIRAKLYERLKIQLHNYPVLLDEFVSKFVESYVNAQSVEQNMEELKQIKDDDFHEDFFEDEDLFLYYAEEISPQLLPSFVKSIDDGEYSDIMDSNWYSVTVE